MRGTFQCATQVIRNAAPVWAVGSHPGPIRYTPSGPSGIPAHPDSIRIWPIQSGYVAKMGMLRLNIGSGMCSIGLGP